MASTQLVWHKEMLRLELISSPYFLLVNLKEQFFVAFLNITL